MFNIHDWDSIYEYIYEQAMNEVTDEDYAHAYGKSQADLIYISEWRSKWAERRKYKIWQKSREKNNWRATFS